MPTFDCQSCGKQFEVQDSTLAKYPGWQPKRCLACKNKQASVPKKKAPSKSQRGAASSSQRGGGRSSSREENLTTGEVLAKYSAGPLDGVFTDGSAEPNPGPGGWGAVYVVDNRVVAERDGHEGDTTNNRMELTALIQGAVLVPAGTRAIVYSDSQLCVSTINEWAAGWERQGWKRKSGAIKNLELVQEAYALFKSRPELELRWIAAHSGNRWNEYADALATAYRRARR
jgi:ribonuclease HI